MRVVKWLSWLILALFVVVPLTLYGLLATTGGSKFVINTIATAANQKVSFEQLEGNLLGELQVHGLRYQQEHTMVSAQTLTIDWKPLSLLDRQLIFNKVTTLDLTVQVKSSAAETPPAANNELPNLDFPWELQVRNLSAQNTVLIIDEQSQHLPDVGTSFDWQGTSLNIHNLVVSYADISATATAQVSTIAPYTTKLDVNWNISQQAIGQVTLNDITGTTAVAGDLEALVATTVFTMAGSAAEQQLNLQLTQLLDSPDWQAHLQLKQLPLQLAESYLQQAELQGLPKTIEAAYVDANISLDSNQLNIAQLEVSQLGEQSGFLTISGHLDNYLMAATEPENVQFKLSIQAATIELPYLIDDSFLQITTLNSHTEGALNNYNYYVNANLSYPELSPILVESNGRGTNTSLIIEKLVARSDELNSQLAAAIEWSDSLAVDVEIDSLRAHLPMLDDFEDNTVFANGALYYAEGQLQAKRFEMKWLANQLTLNGAMIANDPLRITATLPELSALNLHEMAVGQLSFTTTVTGDLTTELQLNLEQLDLIHPDFGTWFTQTDAQIRVPVQAPAASFISNICLTSKRNEDANLCFESSAEQKLQRTKISGHDLPIALLNKFRDEAVAERVWGLADLNAEFVTDTSNWALINLNGLVRSENTVLFALDEEVSTAFDYWQLEWNGDPNTISSSFTAELEQQQGVIIGDATVTNIQANPEIQGSVLMQLADLTVMQWILPDLRYTGARALASIDIIGPLSKPDVKGSIELAADEIGFAESGLLFTDVRLTAFNAEDEAGKIELDGQALSGSGWVIVGGDIYPQQEQVTIHIEGQDFRAIQTPNIQVDLSPDITIELRDQRININGEIVIPFADIKQPELAVTATTPSTDIAIYDEGVLVEAEHNSLYPIYANVRLTLGENISVSAFGFEGKLDGSLIVTEQPNRALTAAGSVRVKSGFYELYGQRLNIDRGSLIYSGGPINNPGLDLRVVRSGENLLATENVSVGAQISGTLTEPDFRLFSSPAMPDGEVLSYLILGRGSGSTPGNENMQLQALLLLGSKGTDAIGKPLQKIFGLDEFGLDSTINPEDTSFYIGKYLSPRLYVKYGVGLFQNTNTFLIRYLLSEHLLIETTTSTEAQGGDIFYTIEK